MPEIIARQSGESREYVLQPKTLKKVIAREHELQPDTKLPDEVNEFDRGEITQDPTDREWWEESLLKEAEEIAKIQEEAANRAKKEPKTVTIWDAEGGPIEVPEGFGEIAICFGHDENGKPLYMIKKA